MRSVSRRPDGSKRQRSTAVAWAENRAKFTPFPSQVAPRGRGAPSSIRAIAVEDACLGLVRRMGRGAGGFRGDEPDIVHRGGCQGGLELGERLDERVGPVLGRVVLQVPEHAGPALAALF